MGAVVDAATRMDGRDSRQNGSRGRMGTASGTGFPIRPRWETSETDAKARAVLEPVNQGQAIGEDRTEVLRAGQAARGDGSLSVRDALGLAVDLFDGPGSVAARFASRPSPT
jgi:hypothetical protein